MVKKKRDFLIKKQKAWEEKQLMLIKYFEAHVSEYSTNWTSHSLFQSYIIILVDLSVKIWLPGL